jgi:hypothetical protein
VLEESVGDEVRARRRSVSLPRSRRCSDIARADGVKKIVGVEEPTVAISCCVFAAANVETSTKAARIYGFRSAALSDCSAACDGRLLATCSAVLSPLLLLGHGAIAPRRAYKLCGFSHSFLQKPLLTPSPIARLLPPAVLGSRTCCLRAAPRPRAGESRSGTRRRVCLAERPPSLPHARTSLLE